ncbi:hypothetical protein PUN28_013749 [Cardiocondyla obscurior]|uniref:Uncharacterized protein n=1 Tax=Cardiocondyla obscurior TaxID=286306 RepID=A0AAW2F5C7_9HYME
MPGDDKVVAFSSPAPRNRNLLGLVGSVMLFRRRWKPLVKCAPVRRWEESSICVKTRDRF